MRVEDALRVPGGAGRVAQRRGGALVEHRPFVIAGRRFDPLLVAQQVAHAERGHVRPIGHRNEALDALHLGGERLDQRSERDIEEQELILGVVDDVRDLLGIEARIDRVQHRSAARHAVVELHVAVAVPRERGNALAGLHRERRERVGHLLRTAMDVAVGAPMERPLDRAGDDLGAGVNRDGVLDQRRDEERPILHQSLHRASFERTRQLG